jgi:hypothetical protein
MKRLLIGFWYSMPVQLLLLHFRKYQVFLFFWYILFATVYGSFLKAYGANSLYLAPEYYNNVNAVSTAVVGFAMGIFIMSWNITTFILHSHHIKFLVTTAQPFLKYCINNSLLPITFLICYLVEGIKYARHEELMPLAEIAFTTLGFIGGFVLSLLIAFVYFFSADKTIFYNIGSIIRSANKEYEEKLHNNPLPQVKKDMRVDWFLSAKFQLRKPRDVRHYSDEFLDKIFSHHHVATVIAITIAFLFLIGIGFISDSKLFQIPAAASITILFALLIALSGAFSFFFKNWSILIVLIVYAGINLLYQKEIIDPRNKAYGLNYQNINERPQYNKETINELASDSNIEKDKQQFIKILNNWKANQKEEKPILYIINTSGGGVRSANFTMNVLQQLDSLMNGELMKKTLFINGASGGLLGAAYFRELYYQKQNGANINLQDKKYVENISQDLLNPLFSSFVTRDIIGPVQKFTYNNFQYKKDRGYAFEEKLNENTNGILNKSLKAYALPEEKAIIPFMFFNSVISRDGRKMFISSHPARFLMKPVNDTSIIAFEPDGVDFNSFFQKQNSTDIRILSALRMNATFPYVLPNVWLPTEPVIDVMDAGLRDNFGQETTLRFINVFKDWLKENTSKIVVLQIRDRTMNDWDKPAEEKSYMSWLTTPFLLLQNNWYKLQDYYQHDQIEYLSELYGPQFTNICWQYIAAEKNATASLSFHLTVAEKKGIATALKSETNKKAFDKLKKVMK